MYPTQYFCLKTVCEAGSGVKIWKRVYKEKYKKTQTGVYDDAGAPPLMPFNL